jgi:hypothetical protein
VIGEDDEIETGFTGRPNDLRLAAHGVVGTLCVDAENAGGPDTRRREWRDSKRIRLDGRLGGDPVDAGQTVSTRKVEDDQGKYETLNCPATEETVGQESLLEIRRPGSSRTWRSAR